MRISGTRVGAWLDGICRRHPLFCAAFVTVVCVLAARVHPAWGVLAALVFGALAWGSGSRRKAWAWLFCGLVAVAVFVLRDAARMPLESVAASHVGMPAQGKVLEDARGSERYWVAPVKLSSGDPAGVRIWWEGNGELPVAGARVRARGGFKPLPEPRNPGEFDRADWLRRQGMAAVFRAMRDDTEVETPPLAALGASIRQGFRERVTAGLPDDSRGAHVIRAVVIGEHPPDQPELIDSFRRSGSLHVFCVSGLHVAMVGGIGWLILAWLGVPRRRAVVALIPLVFGYAWITGNGPPAVRAAWMAAVFLGAFAFRRRPDLLNSLGAVLLALMLWNGHLLFQPGVQLSYGVVAAIAIGLAWTTKTFAWMAQPELYLPYKMMNRPQRAWLWLRRWAAGTMAVSLAAGIGSAPLTILHFGIVTPVSVLASLVLLPLVFALLAAALFSAAVFSISPMVSQGVNRLNGGVAELCAMTAGGFASLPGGHHFVGQDKRPRLMVYDLEYGAGAACFTDGKSAAVMIDCGSSGSFRYLVAPSLRRLAIAPDAVVLSHPDGGHLGGGAEVWRMLPIRQAWLPVSYARSPSYREWLEQAPPHGIRVIHGSAGEKLPFPDGASLEVLHLPDPAHRHALADERVAVFRLHWRGWKILLTSDAGMGTELRMLDMGIDVSADVIVAGRNRTDVSLCDRFIDAVNPRAIVASNPPYPESERLPPTSVAYWRSRGIQVIDQGEAGGVTLSVDENGALVIEGFLTDRPLVLTRR